MSFIQNSFRDQNQGLIEKQKAFQAELDKKVNKIVQSLPEYLRPLLMDAAEELEKNLPDELRGPDSVTGDELDARAIYMRLLFKVSNALGHGCSWLR